MEISKISLPARRYLAVKHQGAYNKIGEAFGRLFELTSPMNIEMQGPTAGFWFDDPTKVAEEDLRSAAAFPVASDFKLDHEILFTFDIPAATYWTTTFLGPYSALGEAWQEFDRLIEGIAESDAVCFEEYMNNCDEVKEEEIETRLLVASP